MEMYKLATCAYVQSMVNYDIFSIEYWEELTVT